MRRVAKVIFVRLMETRHTAQFTWGARNIPFSSAHGAARPSLYAELFLSPPLLALLVPGTNERLRARPSPETSGNELSTFLWLRYYMGIVEMPRLKMYWEKDGMFGKAFVRRQMSRDRFLDLQRSLSFDLDALEQHILSCCRTYWTPAQRVDLDEAIAPFKGRYRFRVRIIGKPKTTGLKYFTLTDDKHFIYAFRRYAGEAMTVPQTVAEFVEKLPHAGHILYADKWFGGLPAANEVLQRGHNFTFSCNKRRPTAVWSRLHARLGDTDLVVEQLNDPRITALVWVDRSKAQPKKVNLISSRFAVEEASRMLLTGDEDNELPVLVQDYRSGKSFGDVANASISEYSFRHRQRKWPQAGLTFLLHALMHDAWILHNAHTGRDIELLDFERLCLVGKLTSPPPEPPIRASHLVARGSSRLNCVHCYAHKKTLSSTPYICQTCGVALHPECFVDYHK
jgi:hypothetical protein